MPMREDRQEMDSLVEASAIRYAFIGQNVMGDAALRVLMAQVGAPITVLTRPHTDSWRNPLADSALELGLDVDLVSDRDLSLDAGSQLRLLSKVDIAACCGWPVRIAPAGFGAPRRGIVNLHPGALPQWRGSDPIGWHLAASGGPIVCSVHRMSLDVDLGPVLGQARVAVQPEDTGLSMREACGAALGYLAAQTMLDPSGDRPTTQPWTDPGKVVPPRGTRPAFEPGVMTVESVGRLIRAFSPYPGAVVDDGTRWVGVRWPRAGETATTPLACLDGVVHVKELIR